MPRFCTVMSVLLIAALVISPVFDASAAIKVKTVGRSLNQLTPPVKGATAPAWNNATGLRAVGVQSRTYFMADSVAGTAVWSIAAKPGTSAVTAMDSASGKLINSFKPDVTGQYIISVTDGATTAYDTVFASTYTGVGTDAQAGCMCHMMATPSTPTTSTVIKTAWQATKHATLFKDCITGNEPAEVQRGKGTYRAACIPCHTTGFDKTAANNNFGVQTATSGWDTTWYKGLELYGGAYWVTTGDSSVWNLLSANEKMVATVGCEQCHGPAYDHKTTANKMAIDQTLDPGICNVCHDGARRHSLGTFYNLSLHSEVEIGTPAEGGRANCQPCHTGAGFMYYINNNKDTTGIASKWVTARDAGTPISCQVCHDPHGNGNPAQVRTMSLKGDTLRNGYHVPAALAAKTGNLCGNCHNSRYDVRARVNPAKSPYYGFTSRYGPHYSGQMDMFLGSGGYLGLDTLGVTGIGTHHGLEGGCTTCHMQPRANSLYNASRNEPSFYQLPNHSFSMTDTTYAGAVYKPTDICRDCHGEIEDFNDIKASWDYDRNGKIEGVQTEVQGLLDKLAATLPRDTAGNVIGSGTLSHSDSVAVNGKLSVVGGIWNYYFVKNDRSLGVHNTKYAVNLLYSSLGWKPLSVKQLPGLPTNFALDQNYPNPFNPSTTIRFALPRESNVKLVVYDMTGAVVKTVLNDVLGAGNKEAVWDGTNNSGVKVATGMYIYRLQAGDFSSTKKMLLLK
jgi:hypothetical protein